MRISALSWRQSGKTVEGIRHPVPVFLGAGLMAVLLGGCASETRRLVQPHASHPLGTVDFPITCSERAQVEFNRAVALLHHMTYPQAREAAELETSTPKHPVTPGPTLPAHELLGDLLMEQGQPTEALAAYERSLESYPRRFNSLLGAARAARALGDEPLARTFYQELLEVADGGTRQPAMKEARTYVAEPR